MIKMIQSKNYNVFQKKRHWVISFWLWDHICIKGFSCQFPTKHLTELQFNSSANKTPRTKLTARGWYLHKVAFTTREWAYNNSMQRDLMNDKESFTDKLVDRHYKSDVNEPKQELASWMDNSSSLSYNFS